MWYSFRGTKSSLNFVDMCEAKVLKYSLTCFTVAIGLELSTTALHVSESGVSSEAHGMNVGICCNTNTFPKASLLVHEGANLGSP